MRRVAVSIGLVIAAVVPLAGCAVNPVTGRRELMLVSQRREQELGGEAAKKVEAAIGFVADARLEAYVQQLGARLAAHSPLTGVAYTFHVVDILEPNAFALPGGYVYVSRGLLVLMNSEDELAGVIGHEIGHVAARHAGQRVSRAAPIGIVSGIGAAVTGLVSPMLGDVVGGVGSVANEMLLAPYGREQEREADRVGAELSAKAGWNPAALAGALETLEREEGLERKGERRRSFFATHPPLPERVETVRTFAATLARASAASIAGSTDGFLERLGGLVVGKSAAEGVFDGQRFVHPDFDFTIVFPREWATQNSREAVGAAAPGGQATIVLDVAGDGDDPMHALAAIDAANRTDLASRAERRTIGGRRAAHATTQMRTDGGPLALDITCIAQGGRIYRIIGATRPSNVGRYAGDFRTTAESFRAPTAVELARVRETRLRLARAEAGETIAGLVERTGSVWKADRVAVANELDAPTRLAAGQVVKIAVSEPYAARR